jgi:hypothetical protein
MKKAIVVILIFCSLFANSQTASLDTMKVRSLTMQAQDYAWLCSQLPDSDSTSIVTLRSVRSKVQSVQNPTWTTNITLDSIPAVVVVRWYSVLCAAAASEIAARYTAIKNAISAKTNIAYWIGMIDGQGASDFDRKRNLGKNKIID